MSDDIMAFPGVCQSSVQEDRHEGMTLRDYFAAAALQGLLTNPENQSNIINIAEVSYFAADQMLRARMELTEAIRARSRQ